MPPFTGARSSPRHPGLWFFGLDRSIYGSMHVRRRQARHLAQAIRRQSASRRGRRPAPGTSWPPGRPPSRLAPDKEAARQQPGSGQSQASGSRTTSCRLTGKGPVVRQTGVPVWLWCGSRLVQGVGAAWLGQLVWPACHRSGWMRTCGMRTTDGAVQQHAAGSAYNAHYDRPAVLAALGPVAGRQVLDAACGPGLYLRELLERGAEVTAFDASPVMVRLARAQTAGRVRAGEAVLGESLPYPDDGFDLIVCALAIHYAIDRAAAFAEFCRVLRPGGAAVVSTQHPLMDWLRKGGSYFHATLETDIWHTPSGDQPVRFWREPLSALCTAATDAGFLIEKVIEPVPSRDNARTLSRGLRETEQGTGIPDPAPSQASQARSEPCELTRSPLPSPLGQPGPMLVHAAYRGRARDHRSGKEPDRLASPSALCWPHSGTRGERGVRPQRPTDQGMEVRRVTV